MSETVFVIDLETTGLYPKRGDRILEIAAVPVVDGLIRMEGAFNRLVNPLTPIPPEATRINGITDEMVRGAPPIERVLPEFFACVGVHPLVAHNAAFDVGFLRHYANALGLSGFTNRVVDTIDISKELFPGSKSHSLDALVLRLGIPTGDGKRHRSLQDAFLAALCYLSMRAMR
jgi:DNA polymerase III epsilon subunit